MSRHKTAKSQLREDTVPYRAGHTAGRKLRFVDLFCGIGGFRLAFERAGCECVFSCDWNEPAQRTYAANFGETPAGDIHKIGVADILAHDILCGGFPYQPFSIAGVSKKLSLGRKHGFEDKEQGNLFFEIANIIEYHQPKAFVLENVKNLRSHDKGRASNQQAQSVRIPAPLVYRRKILTRCSARNASSGSAASGGRRRGLPAYFPKLSATLHWAKSRLSLGESTSLSSSSKEINPRSKAASCRRDRQIPFRTFSRSVGYMPHGRM